MEQLDRRHALEKFLPPLLLLLLAAAVYLPTLPGHFFMDDVVIVRDNPLVLAPDLGTIFTTDYWGPGENTELYRPLTILSFALNRLLLGHAAWGYLSVNIALHACVTLLLYLYLPTLGIAGTARWLGAAIFAVHPVHGEAVNELVGRSELLVALFTLLALWLSRRAGRWSLPAVAACFLAALLSKEHGIVLLALLPAVDIFLEEDLAQMMRRRWRLYLALTGVTAGWLLFRAFGVQREMFAPDVFDPYFVPLSTLEYPQRLLMALKLQLQYLGKMFVPFHLQGMYPPSTVLPAERWLSPLGGLVIATFFVLPAACWWGWRRRLPWALAMLLYFISFAPTSNVFILAAVTMADRLTYLPSIWFSAGIAAGICALPRLRAGKGVLTVVALGVLGCYAVAGCVRSFDFRTPESLWRSDLRIDPGNPLSELLLGDELWRQKRHGEAEELYLRLLKREPDFSEASNAYAGMLVELGRYDEAIRYAQHSIKYAVGRYAKASIPLAAAYVKTGRFNEALTLLDEMHGMWKYRPAYWELVGKALEGKNELFSALSAYLQELNTKGPQHRDILRRIARVQIGLHNYKEAETFLRRDLEIDESGEAWNSLGTSLALQGRLAEARQAFSCAVELEPDNPQYRANLERSRAGG